MVDVSKLAEIFPQYIIDLFNKALSEDSIRFHVSRVLIELGNQNLQAVIPIFERALLSDNEQLRWTAMQELVELGKSYPDQIVQLLEQTG